jgi:hypothetical protein
MNSYDILQNTLLDILLDQNLNKRGSDHWIMAKQIGGKFSIISTVRIVSAFEFIPQPDEEIFCDLEELILARESIPPKDLLPWALALIERANQGTVVP